MKIDVPNLPPLIERYQLRKRIRRDNAGEVWLAYDTRAHRPVILKFYHLNRPGVAETLSRYMYHVKQIASLNHPNITHVYDVQIMSSQNSDDYSLSKICLVVEYVEGESLADYTKRTSMTEKMSSSEIVDLFSSLALAIDKAHQNGIVHGNIKPSNILLKHDSFGGMGTPLLTDFAATRLLAEGQQHGTPFYLAPEQAAGGPPEKRSDIYALGVLLYELHTGMPLLPGSRPVAVLVQQLNTPSALTHVILRCLTKDPRGRFPTASSMASSLADALQVTISEDLRQSAGIMDIDIPATSPNGSMAPPTPRSAGNFLPVPIRRIAPKRTNNLLILMMGIALIILFSASFGTLFLLTQKSATVATHETGQAFFVNSGQLNSNTTQGINDELQIDISNITEPENGKSYYAWLLGDVNQTEAIPMFLGRLKVEHGTIHFLYAGNNRHDNLLALSSRLLITEDDTQNPPGDPMLDQKTWRYYSLLPQSAGKIDPQHPSTLDHLRHLLVESPELAARGLHGGLAFWFARNAAVISDAANELADDWQKKDADTIHSQVVRILDYLDGASFAEYDLPSGTPWLADAHSAQLALLGPAQNSDPPGYVYQKEEPPGFVYLVQAHLNGAILAVQTTPSQRKLAIQIGKGIDSVKQLLTQVYQDAKQLVTLTNEQLLGPAALATLDDLAAQAQHAYTGQPNPSTGTAQNGSLWVYTNLQRLVTFDVTPFTS